MKIGKTLFLLLLLMCCGYLFAAVQSKMGRHVSRQCNYKTTKIISYDLYNDSLMIERAAKYVANECNIRNYKDVIKVWHLESQLNIKTKSKTSSGAVGLAQWTPIAATDLKVPHWRIRQMDFYEQMVLYIHTVKLFRKNVKYKKQITSVEQLFVLTHYPVAFRNNVLYTKGSLEYKSNPGVDVNKDGIVDKGDIKKLFQRRYSF